ncbi:MAG: helix-turn-helix domain-containing protein, partial [Cyanobacteria bacterium Co-bin8]|nr:helix-turn-helix domain-containing protein [Cyanobacteria bacterium Co-bin8]
AEGLNVPWIARHLDQHEHTIRSALRRWQKQGIEGLWDAPRSGRPRSWKEEDWRVVEDCLQELHRPTSQQLCKTLVDARQVKLSPRQMSRLLKKRAGAAPQALADLPVQAEPDTNSAIES